MYVLERYQGTDLPASPKNAFQRQKKILEFSSVDFGLYILICGLQAGKQSDLVQKAQCYKVI